MADRLSNDFQFIDVGREDPKKRALRTMLGSGGEEAALFASGAQDEKQHEKK